MSRVFSKKQVYLLLAAILTAAFLFTGLYFWLLFPLKAESALKQNELKSERKLLELLDTKIFQTNNDTFETTVELQKKLPVKPLTEQLILDLEKAETVSNSFIIKMDFSEEGNGAEQSDNQAAAAGAMPDSQSIAAQGPENPDNKIGTAGNVPDQNQPAANQAQENEQLPAGIKKIKVNLTVQSPSYFEMEDFITSLESMPRIIKVDSILFSGTQEITSVEQTTGPLTYQLSVSAFYAPGLTNLQNQLPPMEAPEPSKKRYPFDNAPELNKNSGQ